MTVLLDQAQGVRYRMMTGEDTDPDRRGDKQLVAQSTCSMYCLDGTVFEKTIQALLASDEQLRARPAEEKLYDWQTVYFDPDHDVDTGAGTLVFGVAWYDETFFTDKGAAYLNGMHSKMFANLGVPADSVRVQHWRPALVAA